MNVSPYLAFNGTCEAALKFYERALGAKTAFAMKWGDSPAAEQVPSDWRDKIIHATFKVGSQALYACDAPPSHFKEAQGISISIEVTDAAEAERLFSGLSENACAISMPMQKTFWSPAFGMLIDQFGIPWMVNCTQPA